MVDVCNDIRKVRFKIPVKTKIELCAFVDCIDSGKIGIQFNGIDAIKNLKWHSWEYNPITGLYEVDITGYIGGETLEKLCEEKYAKYSCEMESEYGT